MKSLINTYDLAVNLTLKSLNIKDVQRNSPSIHFNYLARTLDEDKGLIDFDIKYVSRASIDYVDTDIIANTSLGTLEIN